jgi:two-component system, NtrC family, nitrogen regulation response regulator NtrX
MTDTVLIVDDEEPVRRTFEEWLRGAALNLRVLAAADAETALKLANETPIDLAILDWNLGAGLDGLRLLEDLALFRPDIVAILVTGFAAQATPLDALRMGVRDYLDKSTDLTRETFLASVRRQLDKIRPAKRQREFNQSLAAFRGAVEKILPIVQTAAAFNDPVPLPEAVKSLLRFAARSVGAADGALLMRHASPDGSQVVAAYGKGAAPLSIAGVSFSRSIAASVLGRQEAAILMDSDLAESGLLELFPFEKGRSQILAAPLPAGSAMLVVLELFDKPGGFTEDDRRLVGAAAEVGGDLIRQSLAERQSHRLLFDAVEAALQASTGIQEILNPDAAAGTESPAPAAVMASLREGLGSDTNAVTNADTTLKLVEAVRALAVRHGPSAVDHCTRMVDDLRKLLDGITGTA